MFKKSYIFFLLILVPVCCVAFGAKQQLTDFITLKHSLNETAFHQGAFPTQSILAHSTKLDELNNSQDQSPVGKSENRNSDEPEEKEEKNENNEDKDHCVLTSIRLISSSDAVFYTSGLLCTINSLVTTPLYILFHSWKSYLS